LKEKRYAQEFFSSSTTCQIGNLMRPTIAEVDLEAIRHNLRQIRLAVSPSTFITAIVKANAYGHGAIKVSSAALAAGANGLGVAIPEEGAELRENGFTVPIFVLGLTPPEQSQLLVDYNLVATISTLETAQALAETTRRKGRPAEVMLKIDTGMGRVGINPDQALNFLKRILAIPELKLRGVFTHLATADAGDKTYANQQLRSFTATLNRITHATLSLDWISAANSATIIDLPHGHFNMVRPGIILYGLLPSKEMRCDLHVMPAMQFKTRVVYLKEVPPGTKVGYGSTHTASRKTLLATLPVGYADGYSRHLSNKASILIRGRRCPVVGRVCMDQIIADLGSCSDTKIGDEAVLFGRQGDAEISVTELADLAGTINYELVCAISSRVPRVYINE
jgi:alanine racemase